MDFYRFKASLVYIEASPVYVEFQANKGYCNETPTNKQINKQEELGPEVMAWLVKSWLWR